ncbi:RiPP maturation radical SAM C-methyltransferase [Planobispora takensis]|uniref:RiPP maturation radical SAM protein 1 n=1 Tax=Planobispora takensis TaxID=1367882 RepID=A0A8J3SWF6_9ACTN|nr:RiPP maturation radical SAM C-methyltransferase [Planobispora takensis]GII00048.1 RiPP maturation radical SAM protein 1 [Planobispora takensis]
MKVLFAVMPFGGLRPAIGVSLLTAHLERAGTSAEIRYLNLRFAELVGGADYDYVAERLPTQALAGDWIFARAAFGPDAEADAAYLAMLGERFPAMRGDGALDALHRCRAAADGFLEEALGSVDWGAYDVVGFTSTFTQHAACLAMARRVKERFPQVTVAFGGANCEAEMGLQLHRSFPFVDIVCSGEADISFPRVVEALRRGGDPHEIPGVIARHGGRSRHTSLTPERVEDLDALPYPDYDDFFAQAGRPPLAGRGRPGVLMESSRGCWWGQKHHCTFCGLNGLSMAFRSKSAARVLDELTALCERYSPAHVEMVDNILDMHYFRDLIPELKRRGLELGLFFEVKAKLSKQQVRDLYDAGIRTIQPGVESLSTPVLTSMRKGVTAVQNVQLLKWCKELGVKPFWNLIYGFPGEDPGEYEATVAVIEAIGHLQPPYSVGRVRLDRFSPYFFDAALLGIRGIRPDRSYRHIYGLPEDELANLAYYFEYDYADGRDPEAYVDRTKDAVRRWHEEAHHRGLISVDHGDALAVWDLRPRAARTLTILEGSRRAVYLYCDQHRSADDVAAHLADDGRAGAGILDDLVRDRLMIHLDGRYLSLAVPAPPDQQVPG